MPTGVYQRPVRACSVCGKSSDVERVHHSKKLSGVYCNAHYLQIKRNGSVLEYNIKEKNSFIPCDDYTEIVLKDKSGNEVGRAKVDNDDVEKCLRLKWRLAGRGYAMGFVYSNKKQKNIKLHIHIFGKKDGLEIDHINRDKLDNRKGNLRFVSHGDNMLNATMRVDNRSGFTGVFYDTKRNKWLAHFRGRYIGRYVMKDDAIAARKKAEKEFEVNY